MLYDIESLWFVSCVDIPTVLKESTSIYVN